MALLLLELKTGCASLNVNHTSSISRDDISTPATRCATWENLLDRLRVNGDVEARKSQTRWNILHHLGGNGPWIKMSEDDETAQNVSPPLGCFIDQVHMISRHAERYPTPSVGRRHLSFLERARNLKSPFNSSLEFLNNWTYFTDNPERDFGQLTTTGPYAGALTAFTTGVQFRTRYKDLLGLGSSIRFWASDSQRVIDSARHFAAGLFGLDWETRGAAELEIIPEIFERGANTLTPGNTCRRYLEDSDHGHENGYTMLGKYQDLYTPGISQRLVAENPSFGNLSSTEIYGMQEMCGFEIMIRGHSSWCSVFTEDDRSHFEYARDIKHYYGSGPGNPYGGAMGWLWLNATTELLQAGPEAGSLFFSL
ncbi:hypothetical protein PDE_03429 [Penicillium oxalicum 114-2]|uniref:3-phytase n=1 Tax=Penicillium oxalicum (strain 114-2 / CGMCC 5302) TaxID=933388 RepID=S8AR53_PENO1|nr:hypothetical protein PDE_03429 [Penicillium oxalicum 114-2]